MLGGHATGAPRGIPSERWVPVGWLWWALDLPLACQGWSTGRDRCPGAGWSSALPIRGGSDELASTPAGVPSPLAPGFGLVWGWALAGPGPSQCGHFAGGAGRGPWWGQSGLAFRGVYCGVWIGPSDRVLSEL